MKTKAKEILVYLPHHDSFDSESEVVKFCSVINSILHGKSKTKYEILGKKEDKVVAIVYLKRDADFQNLRDFLLDRVVEPGT